MYLLLVFLPVVVLVAVLVVAVALLVRFAMGLFGFLLVYWVLAERERDCPVAVLEADVFCKLLLERFAGLAAVIELLLRVADEFVWVSAALRSLFAAVLVPAAVAPATPVPVP